MVGSLKDVRDGKNLGYCKSITTGLMAPQLESSTWEIYQDSKWTPQSSVSIKAISETEHKSTVIVCAISAHALSYQIAALGCYFVIATRIVSHDLFLLLLCTVD